LLPFGQLRTTKPKKVAGFAPATCRNGMCDSTNRKVFSPAASSPQSGNCQKQKWECTDGWRYPCIPISIGQRYLENGFHATEVLQL
jgi:hypothetical protein